MPPAPERTGPLGVDRRRSPRHESSADLRLSLPNVTNGEVIDLSVTGALISTKTRLEIGDRARLSLVVGRQPFQAWVTVVRVEEGTRSGGEVRYHTGVTFLSLDEGSRDVLQRFVRRDS